MQEEVLRGVSRSASIFDKRRKRGAGGPTISVERYGRANTSVQPPRRCSGRRQSMTPSRETTIKGWGDCLGREGRAARRR